MNRIAIVGHPASGYQDIEHTLRQCGMQPAHPSRRDSLLPQDITAALCKAHAAPAVQIPTEEADLTPLAVGPLWNGMAMDLMLGNLDQELWGWADPQTLYTLDYWQTLDPKLTFVLVYDEPHRALMQAGAELQPPTLPEARRILDNWTAYNGALLHFYLRHRDRCLLVHAQQVRRAADRYVQQLQPLLDTPLQHLPAQDLAPQTAAPALAPDSASSIQTLLPAQRLNDIAGLIGLEIGCLRDTLQASATERHLLTDLLKTEHQASLQRYAELQASASLPLDPPMHGQIQTVDAWNAWTQQRAMTANLANRLHVAYQETARQLAAAAAAHAQQDAQWQARHDQALSEHEQQLQSAHDENQRLHEQARQLTDQQRTGTQQLSEREQQLQSAQEENQMLLDQLHQVQLALEQQYLEKKALETRQPGQEDMLQQGAAQQTHQALVEENAMLLDQLQQAQDELERYYLENQKLQNGGVLPNPNLYGAAERVKQQLDYRLGAVMLKHSRSLRGWLSLPRALAAEKRAYERESQSEGIRQPLHAYRDAQEAERIKRHLSYRLGHTLLKHGGSPIRWITLPFALGRQVTAFRAQRS
ncbi:hypothetical protein [Chromobacterium violaceum]|uniref:hypothetical protein n=1 Tax=Chromobacterium violaceum TaxID=536 RepID=UPI00143D2A44|nr:hypothetical protein [Chromobacterium violaceum]QIY79028.1 hypothetical protein FOB43_07380 [Chromobacterium violaceum]